MLWKTMFPNVFINYKMNNPHINQIDDDGSNFRSIIIKINNINHKIKSININENTSNVNKYNKNTLGLAATSL